MLRYHPGTIWICITLKLQRECKVIYFWTRIHISAKMQKLTRFDSLRPHSVKDILIHEKSNRRTDRKPHTIIPSVKRRANKYHYKRWNPSLPIFLDPRMHVFILKTCPMSTTCKKGKSRYKKVTFKVVLSRVFWIYTMYMHVTKS